METVKKRPAPVYFERVWAVFGLLLVGGTWKLWTPQSQFPQIPWFDFLIDIPAVADWIALFGIVVSWGIVLCGQTERQTRIGLMGVACFLTGSILLDQH